jgi:hypothetical protein
MAKPRLHLDADTSIRALHKALSERGHDVTRTPTEWMPLDADDETQLLRATARGRVIFTFNIRDFTILGDLHPQHGGIVLAAQRSWSLSAMISALDSLLAETNAEEWLAQTRWLNQWRVIK